ncbi:MAG: hypothetical protein GY841_10435 [FCB group bacterium]|nr:hypothetical protein [FCB group bacterium]
MAITCALTHDIDSLSFQDGSSGLQLAKNGWLPGVTVSGEPVVEVLRLEVTESDTDSLAAVLQDLELFSNRARQYMSGIEKDPVLFITKMDNETGGHGAVVLSMEYSYGASWFDGVASESNTIPINVTIKRTGGWQGNVHYMAAGSTDTGIVIRYDHTGGGASPVEGTLPARVNGFVVENRTVGETLDRLWIGLRSTEQHGDLSLFAQTWELEDGTNTARGGDHADATASDGNRVRGTPSGADTWEEVLTITLSDVVAVASYNANLGWFLWLLRAKVSGGTFQVRLRWGYEGLADDDHIMGPIQEVTNTSWDVINCGISHTTFLNEQMPDPVIPAATSVYGSYHIQVWIKQVGASDETIDLDCLMPLPIDEGYLIVDNANMDYEEEFVIATNRAGIQQAVTYNSAITDIVSYPDIEPVDFALPIGQSNMFGVFARAAEQDITDSIRFGGTGTRSNSYEQWKSLRGAS